MTSDKPALVLLHGLNSSGNTWSDVVPLVSQHHEVHTPTIIGHRGGPPLDKHPTTTVDLVDGIERYLDEHGLDRPHVGGNSLGGFAAIELARRGRAATVCAFSPGGLWSAESKREALSRVQGGKTMARITRPLVALTMRSAAGRRRALGIGACDPGRLTARQAVAYVDDFINCTVTDDVCSDDNYEIAALDPLPCPIAVVWGEHDSILPLAAHGHIARERLPRATFTVLPGVGHVPMIDDPDLVARTILAVTGAG